MYTSGPRRGRRRLGLLAAGLAVAALTLTLLQAPANALILPRTYVSFTFDDGLADNMTAIPMFDRYNMDATFYINSALIGQSGYMTRANLDTLKSKGHEIGGHTVTHQSLITLSPAEANRQVCTDRNTLTSWGYRVTSFAYPFADVNDTAKSIVQQCGYNTGRAVGDIWSPETCTDCPNAESVHPLDPYALRTPDDIDTTWSLAELKQSVQRAERNGGWLVYNLHHVCDGCNPLAISPTVLNQFLSWLSSRWLIQGTYVRTVDQVVGGTVKPTVTPAAPPAPQGPGVNVARNPSLETPGDGSGNPECWSPSGYGTNTPSFARVPDAHTSSWAERVTISSLTDGDAKLVPRFDLGECSPLVQTGHSYTVKVWYKSSAEVFFTMYQRNAIGQWAYWTQSPRLPAAADWTEATWTTPAVPSGMVATSFGLTLDSVGTLTTDDYSFADAG
ncbi:polysaccharide deacetylase family protein [Flindersiella endophytica]